MKEEHKAGSTRSVDEERNPTEDRAGRGCEIPFPHVDTPSVYIQTYTMAIWGFHIFAFTPELSGREATQLSIGPPDTNLKNNAVEVQR